MIGEIKHNVLQKPQLTAFLFTSINIQPLSLPRHGCQHNLHVVYSMSTNMAVTTQSRLFIHCVLQKTKYNKMECGGLHLGEESPKKENLVTYSIRVLLYGFKLVAKKQCS